MPLEDTLFLKIKSLIPALNPALKKIALYIIDNPHKIKYLKIKDLAQLCGVSEATVTRFVKATGYKSFQELKINIVEITRDRTHAKEFVYDDVIGISNSGRTVSTVKALHRARERNAKTICITNHEKSPITDYADIKLFTAVHDPTFFQESMISSLAQILIIDILYAGLAVKHFPDSIKMIEKSSESLRHVLL